MAEDTAIRAPRSRRLAALATACVAAIALTAPGAASAQVPTDPVPESLNPVCVPTTVICVYGIPGEVNGRVNPVIVTVNTADEIALTAVWNAQALAGYAVNCVNATLSATRC